MQYAHVSPLHESRSRQGRLAAAQGPPGSGCARPKAHADLDWSVIEQGFAFRHCSTRTVVSPDRTAGGLWFPKSRRTLREFLEFASRRLNVLANLGRHARKLAPLRRLGLDPARTAACAGRAIREQRGVLRRGRGAERGGLDGGAELGRAVKVRPRHGRVRAQRGGVRSAKESTSSRGSEDNGAAGGAWARSVRYLAAYGSR